jgi:hypothetical protein
MPPSGYSPVQSNHIVAFLASCSEALETECRGAGRTALEGLQKEQADIAGALAAGWDNALSEHVLCLTGEFYKAVAARAPLDFVAYRAAVQDVLDEVGASVLAVHI